MHSWRMVIEYDGTAFHGWQVQPDARTVQGELRDALATVLREEITLTGAGRTDAGVHALGQVGSFDTPGPIDPHRLIRSLNALTGDDITVHEIVEARPGFSARFDACARTYRYRLLDRPSALLRTAAWHPPHPLDHHRIEAATVRLLGRHDNRSFAASSDTSPSHVCDITRAGWAAWEGGRQLVLTADRFLHHMVRNLVGTLVEIGRGRFEVADFTAIREARDRSRAGPTAPPHGLTLLGVDYPPEPLDPGSPSG